MKDTHAKLGITNSLRLPDIGQILEQGLSIKQISFHNSF